MVWHVFCCSLSLQNTISFSWLLLPTHSACLALRSFGLGPWVIGSDTLWSDTGWVIPFQFNHLSALSSILLSPWWRNQTFSLFSLGSVFVCFCAGFRPMLVSQGKELNVHQIAYSVRGLRERVNMSTKWFCVCWFVSDFLGSSPSWVLLRMSLWASLVLPLLTPVKICASKHHIGWQSWAFSPTHPLAHLDVSIRMFHCRGQPCAGRTLRVNALLNFAPWAPHPSPGFAPQIQQIQNLISLPLPSSLRTYSPQHLLRILRERVMGLGMGVVRPPKIVVMFYFLHCMWVILSFIKQ